MAKKTKTPTPTKRVFYVGYGDSIERVELLNMTARSHILRHRDGWRQVVPIAHNRVFDTLDGAVMRIKERADDVVADARGRLLQAQQHRSTLDEHLENILARIAAEEQYDRKEAGA